MKEIGINKQAKLSDHFTLGEMTKTSVKTKDGNIPSHVSIENLKRVCGWLEELRLRGNLNKKEKIKNKSRAGGEVSPIFFVPLTSSKVLFLDNKNKKAFLFCIVLAYPYLCNIK